MLLYPDEGEKKKANHNRVTTMPVDKDSRPDVIVMKYINQNHIADKSSL